MRTDRPTDGPTDRQTDSQRDVNKYFRYLITLNTIKNWFVYPCIA